MKAFNYWYLLAICCAIASCHNAENASVTVTTTIPKLPVLQQPFRFHKLIEVAPGMDYDIFSWGRGSAGTGAYLILHSDSAGKQYTTSSGDLDGKLVDAFNTDLDTDGNPEIFIQSQTADSTKYEKIDGYEFNGNDAHKLDFPKLTSSQKKGYHGGDDFSIKDNKLIRTYPVYGSDNANAKPTGEKRSLEYSFHGNSFSVKQVSTDDISNTTGKPSATTAPAKEQIPEPKAPARHETHHNHHENRHKHQHESRNEARHHESERKHRSSSRHREEGRKRHHHRR